MLTSDSAEEFVLQLGTLDAIAGHTNDVVAEVAERCRGRRARPGRRRRGRGRGAAGLDDDRRAAGGPRGADRRLPAAVRRADRRAAGGGRRRPTAARPSRASPAGSSRPARAAQAAVDTALAQVGDPYVWGAGGPDAFDCSGLTQYAYSAAGVSLPHSSRSQSQMGTPVSRGSCSRATCCSSTARPATWPCTSATARWCTPRRRASRSRSSASTR